VRPGRLHRIEDRRVASRVIVQPAPVRGVDRDEMREGLVALPDILELLDERIAGQQAIASRRCAIVRDAETPDMIARLGLFAQAREQMMRPRVIRRVARSLSSSASASSARPRKLSVAARL